MGPQCESCRSLSERNDLKTFDDPLKDTYIYNDGF